MTASGYEPGVLEGLRVIDGGWWVKETQTHYVEVHRMLYNDRIMTVPKAEPWCVDRYWCYEPGGPALHAAMLWDGADDTEPVGWKKAHGERYPDSAPDDDARHEQRREERS